MSLNFVKMKFSKMKFLLLKKNDLMWNDCLALPVNVETMYMKCYLCMNSISGLCLCLRDTALNLTAI